MNRAAISFVLMLGLAACGPSTQDVHTASLTVYQVQPDKLVGVVTDTINETYKVASVDNATRTILTEPKLYSATGELESAGADNTAIVQPGSFSLAFKVIINNIGNGEYTVEVSPQVLQIIDGSPKPREMDSEDPQVPGWIKGRSGALALAIHDRAKPFAVIPK